MKYSQPTGNRAIGRVANRRWSGNGLYCSRRARDDYPAARPTHADAKLFAWLLAPRAPRERTTSDQHNIPFQPWRYQ